MYRDHHASRTGPTGRGSGLCAVLLLALVPGPLLAADWYVDASNPNCPGSGTSTDPFCTIASAIAAAASDDTIYVVAGNYSPGAVQISKNLSIVGGPGVVVHGALSVVEGVGPAFRVDFQDLEIRGTLSNVGCTVTLSNSTVTSNGGTAVSNVASACCDLAGLSIAHLTITDCTITATGEGGTAVRNNSFDSTSSFGTTASATVAISNSTLSATYGMVNYAYLDLGSWPPHIGTSSAVVTVANTTIAGSAEGIRNSAWTDTYGQAGSFQCAADVTITNSTVAGAPVGISNRLPSTPHSMTKTEIANTIVAGNGQDLSGTVTSLGHNCISNTAGGTLAGNATGNLLNVDPMFVDAAGGDLRLLPASPCIDTGDPTSLPTGLDLGGNPRSLDGDLDAVMRVDMGAYEFGNVQLAITGSPTPGGQLTFNTTGKAGLRFAHLLGVARGETLLMPWGTLFVDLAAPIFLHSGTIPSRTIANIPLGISSADLHFQDLAIDPTNLAGNTSNPVTVTIR